MDSLSEIKMRYNVLLCVIFPVVFRLCACFFDDQGYTPSDNAQDIAGVRASGLRSVTDRACLDGMVTDVALDRCVPFACPNNFKEKDLRCVSSRPPTKPKPQFHNVTITTLNFFVM